MRLIAASGVLLALTVIGSPATPVAPYAGPCDTISGCAAAYSMTRAMRAAYTGNLFQLYNGSTTLDIGQINHVADTSGVAAFCAGVLNGCLYSKIYDQSGNGNTLLPVNSSLSTTNAPAVCKVGTGNVCASIYWLDPANGLPAIVTTYPTEYETGPTTGINGGANPASVWFHGRDEFFPTAFGIGHAPSQAPLVNGTDLGLILYATNRGINPGPDWPLGYIQCATLGQYCLGVDEETSVEPFTVSTQAGGIGVQYSTGTPGNVNVMSSYDGLGATGTVKGYVNSSTALFSDSPPSSQQYDGSTMLPGTDVKLGCGGDCVQAPVLFREGLVANATLSSADYTAMATNVANFYALHTSRATCSGGADLAYYSAYDSVFPYADYNAYSPTGNGVADYALAQIRASYFGPIADLNNGTTTTTFSGALAAGGAGCGLDPAAATFCTAGSLGHCIVTKLYNQGTLQRTAPVASNVHDTALDLVFASGQRPVVTFNSLNGLPTMNFTGAGERGCATLASQFGGWFGFSAVGRRTSGTAFANLFSNPDVQLAFDNSAGNVSFIASGGSRVAAATDTHWHHIYMEPLGSSTYHPYVDGVAATTFSSSVAQFAGAQYCIGSNGDGTQPLTGDIAEIDVINVQGGPGQTNGTNSQASAAFSQMQTTWGALPN